MIFGGIAQFFPIKLYVDSMRLGGLGADECAQTVRA